jgi:pSer/pThr/pTyr-binding forkhead associated (FHA) protein
VDCFVQLSGTERDRLISRHHCRLDIDPPLVRVEDLGSINGTYVNGQRVDPPLKDLVDLPGAETKVKHGDLITIGGTTFQVDVVDCPHAGEEWEGKPIWEPGQTAKKDCPLAC